MSNKMGTLAHFMQSLHQNMYVAAVQMTGLLLSPTHLGQQIDASAMMLLIIPF